MKKMLIGILLVLSVGLCAGAVIDGVILMFDKGTTPDLADVGNGVDALNIAFSEHPARTNPGAGGGWSYFTSW